MSMLAEMSIALRDEMPENKVALIEVPASPEPMKMR